MNVPFGARLGAFLAAWVLMAIVSMGLAWFFTRAGVTTPRMRVATVLQDVLMFVVPPLIAAIISSRLPARFLLLNPVRNIVPFFLVLLVSVVMIPAMNCIVAFNERIALPESMSWLEQWMKSSEESATGSLRILMGEPTVSSLIMNILIVGVLAGFSEELFFRGGLQQLLLTRPMSITAAVWTTAVVFSAVHLQWYGFVPRLLLGAWFGYLAVWSKTIWLPITAHIANNVIVVVAHWMLNRGATQVNLDNVGTHGNSDMTIVLGSVVATLALIYAVRVFCRHTQD